MPVRALPWALMTASADGNRTVRPELNGAPLPLGRKRSVWSSGDVQCPGTGGVRVGSLPLKTCETGCEKVSRIGPSGSVCAPGPGEASTTGWLARGNQVTRTGAPSFSHGRAAAATANAPAAVFVGSVAVWPDRVAPPTDTRSTGVSNCTCACPPRATVTQRFTTCAAGASTVSVSCRSSPSAQLSQPGRRIVTASEIRSPGATFLRGVSRPCETTSPTARPSSVRARTRTRLPANGCSSTRPSATESVARVAPDISQMPAAATTATSTKAPSASQRPRCDRFLGGGLLYRTGNVGETVTAIPG